MKKNLVVLLLLSSIQIFAQQFEKGDKTLMIGLSTNGIIYTGVSPAGSVMYRIYKSETKALRLGAHVSSYTNTYVSNYESDRDSYYRTYSVYNRYNNITKYTSTGNSLSFSLGLEKTLFVKEKFSTYYFYDIGAIVSFNTIKNDNKFELIETDTVQSSNGYNSGYANYDGNYDNTLTKNLRLGITPQIGIGMKYFITPYIALGTEISYGIYFSTNIYTEREWSSKEGDNVNPKFKTTASPFTNIDVNLNYMRAQVTLQFLLCKPKSE